MIRDELAVTWLGSYPHILKAASLDVQGSRYVFGMEWGGGG